MPLMWRPEEEKFLVENADRMPLPEIAKALGKSVVAVRAKLWRLRRGQRKVLGRPPKYLREVLKVVDSWRQSND